MTESTLTADLLVSARVQLPGSLCLKHCDRFNRAYPDLSVTWQGVTSWWEVKFYNEKMFGVREDQLILCQKLAAAGRCHYIIYELRHGVQRTRIVHPKHLGTWASDVTHINDGFKHAWVIQNFHQMHTDYRMWQ